MHLTLNVTILVNNEHHIVVYDSVILYSHIKELLITTAGKMTCLILVLVFKKSLSALLSIHYFGEFFLHCVKGNSCLSLICIFLSYWLSQIFFFNDCRIVWVTSSLAFLHFCFTEKHFASVFHALSSLSLRKGFAQKGGELLHSTFFLNPTSLSYCVVQVTWFWASEQYHISSSSSKAGEELYHDAARRSTGVMSVFPFPNLLLLFCSIPLSDELTSFHSLPPEH